MIGDRRPDRQARRSAWLAASAIAAFAVCAQLRILDAATLTVIFAGWAFCAAWLTRGASGRARWRARLVDIAAHGAETIETLDPGDRPDDRLRVPLHELLGSPPDARAAEPAGARTAGAASSAPARAGGGDLE